MAGGRVAWAELGSHCPPWWLRVAGAAAARQEFRRSAWACLGVQAPVRPAICGAGGGPLQEIVDKLLQADNGIAGSSAQGASHVQQRQP